MDSFELLPSPSVYPPPVSAISGALMEFYSGLSLVDKKSFQRIYRHMFNYFMPLSDHVEWVNILAYYFLIPVLLKKYHLKPADLSVLSWMWLLSGGGKHAVKSTEINIKTWQTNTLRKLRLKGYFSRSHNNPAQPYSCKSYQKVWISFTLEGMSLYKNMIKDIRNEIIRFHDAGWFNDNHKALTHKKH